ncbi:hypothetical protein C8Q76DRAFT_59394 [Earliella scabrosa]|nr:hypothetical protein C8Q76DRAFT_59394 [Earliella scabrosa]
MAECTTCKRVLKNEAALVQHCRDKGHPYVAPRTSAPAPSSTPSAVAPSASAVASSSTAHVLIECSLCSITFNDKTSYDQHVFNKHPSKPYKCAPCALQFSSAEALAIHFRHHPSHPKCPQCNSAFLDQTQLKLHQAIHPKCIQCELIFLHRAQVDEHVAVAHPVFKCGPCKREFANAADRNRHFQDSTAHPICFVCRDGFVDDAELDKHLSGAHLDTKCRLCNRQFRLVDDLHNHYFTSSAHPHCALCEVGFPDDESCDKHMETNHPRPPPRMPSPEFSMASPVRPSSEMPSSLETQVVSQMIYPPSMTQRQTGPMINGPTSQSLMASLGDDDSDADDDLTYQTVEASSHVQRAISEPTVPTISSIGYGSVHDESALGWRSPTLSDRSMDYPSLRGMARHPHSESTLSLQSAPSSLSASPRPNGSTTADLPAAPHPSNLEPRVPGMVTGPTASIISQSVSPRIQSPIVSTRSFSSLSEHIARYVSPPVRPSLSRQPTPRVPTPVLSPVRSHAPATPVPPSKSISRSSSSLKQPATVVAAPLSSDAEETIPGPAETPKAKAIPLAKSKAKPAAWHCRICKDDPCTIPMAAMCGHIFCTPCILQELVKTGSCPVCRKMILLRLQVEPE